MRLPKTKGMAGWILVTALSLAPILPWIAMEPLSTRFETLAASLQSIGQILGLIGMAMFSLTFVLSARHPILERFFDGINRAYMAHHRFGAIAFSLLLFHPIALAMRFVIIASTRDAALFLLSTNPAILWGTTALLSMMAFLVLTFFVKFAYHKWKFTHQFLSASFIFAAMHTLIIYSDTQASPVLYWSMVAYIILGFIAIAYRTLAPQLFVAYTEYIVDEVRTLNETTTEIYMVPTYRPIAHKAGQFIFISFGDEVVGKESHPFSITSAPGERRLSIAVKTLGDHTGKFKLIAKNTIAKIEGPFGTFSHERGMGTDQVWIAGGIGVTPFIGMARSITDPAYTITLYYCVNNTAEAVFLEELLAVEKRNPNIRPKAFCSNEHGHISAEAVEKYEGDLRGKDFFICGPDAMMRTLRDQLLRKGIDPSRIHTEEFSFR